MPDLLTPEKVREIEERQRRALNRDYLVPRLCRDYLTLWDRNKELEAELKEWGARNGPYDD